ASAEGQQAVSRLEQLVAESSHDPILRRQLAWALSMLAKTLSARGQRAEVRQVVERVIRHQKAAIQVPPENVELRNELGSYYWHFAMAFVREKEHGEAAKIAVELAQLARVNPDDPHNPYCAACCLSLCVSLAKQDTTLTESQRQVLADKYA